MECPRRYDREPVVPYGLGLAHVLNDEWSQAAPTLERVLEIARQTRAGLVWEAQILAFLAQAYLGLGDNGRARATVDEAVAVARQRGTKFFECEAHLTRASVLLWSEGAAASTEIQNALGEAQALVEETGGRSQEPFIHEVLAGLAQLLVDESTQDRELREAHRLFTEMSATGHAERVAKELEKSKVARPASAAEKSIVKGNTGGAKSGRTRRSIRQTTGRKIKK